MAQQHSIQPITPRMTTRGIRPLRVAVHRWGVPEQEAQGILMHCPTFDGRLEWVRGGHGDVVIHLVDAARLSGPEGRALWNAMGPVQAMHAARRSGSLEVALVRGSASQLPVQRAGCWILAGSRSLAGAMAMLLRTAMTFSGRAGARAPLAWIRELASHDTTCLLRQECEPAALDVALAPRPA